MKPVRAALTTSRDRPFFSAGAAAGIIANLVFVASRSQSAKFVVIASLAMGCIHSDHA